METLSWLRAVKDNGLLCKEYADKVACALSKKQLMDIILDSNGVSYLMEMQGKGFPLLYETILKEFKGYINGGYEAEHKNSKGNGYTSAMYCCYPYAVCQCKTTLSVMLGCNTTVIVPAFDFVKIYADTNCALTIECPETSRCIVECWGNAIINTKGCKGKVNIIKH